MIPFEKSRLELPANEVALHLLGAVLVHRTHLGLVSGVIVETEAYDQQEPACHAYRGQTPRNSSLFMSAGHAYVYLSYGLHACMNVVVGQSGYGSGVLLRAIEPLDGDELMFQFRQKKRKVPLRRADLGRGPGNLSRAMGIDLSHDAHNLLDESSPLRLLQACQDSSMRPRYRSPRIGISQAQHFLWRYFLGDSPSVSGSKRQGAERFGQRSPRRGKPRF